MWLYDCSSVINYMRRGDYAAVGSGDWRFPTGAPDPSAPRQARSASLSRPWVWLEQLRYRFDLAVEVLDTDLHYVSPPAPDVGRAVDVRVGLNGPNAAALREAAAVVLRSAKPKSFTVGQLRIRLFPLFGSGGVPRAAVGLLVVADASPMEGEGEGKEQLEQRLDAAGQWLTAAIEATLHVTALTAAQERATERLTTMIDMLDALSRADDARQVLEMAVEGLALWYDADVRGYRQDLSGAFVLDVWLPGLDITRTARRLEGHAIIDHDALFRLESVRDLEDLGWDATLGDTRFLPIVVGDATEWLLTVSGAQDPSIEPTLGFLRQVLGMLLTRFERDTADRISRNVIGMLSFGGAPADARVRLGLDAVASGIQASGAHLSIFYEGVPTPAMFVAWGERALSTPAPIAAESTIATPHALTLGAAAGMGVTAVLQFEKRVGAFSTADVRIARAASATLISWLSAILTFQTEPRRATASSLSSDLATQLRNDLDGAGRIRIPGALAVVLAPAAPSGPELDDIVQILQDGVRSSDVIGIVAGHGAGSLLSGVDPDTASAISERVRRLAGSRGMSHLQVGITTFGPSSDTPEALLERAQSNARRGSARE